MFFNTKHTTALCFVTCMAFSSSSIADIVISGTRVIYKSDQKSVNVRLENKGNNPLLVQSWLDTGDDNAEPGSITVPFTATPPVSRIDAKRGQTIKLMYTASTSLPKDRESVFWFNVLEVPPKPDAEKVANQSLLRTPPLGPQDQPDYLNAAVALETSLAPEELLNHTQRIELQQGRVRKAERWGPRTLDLDIMLFGNEVINTERLTVPHYDMKNRGFMLWPLFEIAPELAFPDGETLREVLHTRAFDKLSKW